MRVAKLVMNRKFELAELPMPSVETDTDVQVNVKVVGICGTDLHIFQEGRADVQLPRIMGHELSGVVTATGPRVDRVRVGDRVVLDPVFACGSCLTCRKGHPNVCEDVRCYGVQMDGAYQDYIVVDQKHLYPFVSSISFQTAAMAEPFSIAANILHRAGLTAGENLLILGGGTIGLAVLQVAKGLGARVMLADIMASKLETAQNMGADAVVNSREGSLPGVAGAFAPIGFDVVVDAVGSAHMLEQALDYAAPCARILCIGFDARPAAIPPVVVTKKELSILGSRMNCGRFPVVMQWLSEGRIQANAMISRKYPLEQIQQAFEETIADSAHIVKTLIVLDKEESCS